jgi:hypothetical protein
VSTQINGSPRWTVWFDENGRLTGDDNIVAELAAGDVTDLFIFSHGWNSSAQSANRLYDAMFPLISDVAAGQAQRIGFAGVLWPSLLFPEDDPANGPGVAQTPAPDLVAALKPAFPDDGQQAGLDRMGTLLHEQAPDPQPLREFHQLLDTLVTTKNDAAEDDGERAVLTQSPGAVFGQLAGLSKTPGGFGQGLLDPFRSLWHGAREALRVASYYEMKNRAGVVGRHGLGPLVARLAAAKPGLRVHLLGHSFGARLVAYALTGLPSGSTGAASPVKSLMLVQGAFSHFTFAAPMPIDAGRSGSLANALGNVDGPLVATFSRHDRAVGWWYPAASMLQHEDSQSLTDLTFRWGGMGHDGYQQAGAREVALGPAGTGYDFGSGAVVRLNSDSVIADEGQSAFAGAHSDILHPEVAWAAVAASRAGVSG